jgi:hypothetical protein
MGIPPGQGLEKKSAIGKKAEWKGDEVGDRSRLPKTEQQLCRMGLSDEKRIILYKIQSFIIFGSLRA